MRTGGTSITSTRPLAVMGPDEIRRRTENTVDSLFPQAMGRAMDEQSRWTLDVFKWEMLFVGNAGLMAAMYGMRPLIAGLAVAMFFLGIVTAGYMLWHYRRGTLDKADYDWRKDVRLLLPMLALAHAGAFGWYLVAR